MDDLAALLQTDIPKDRSNLLDSHANLERVAEYCESNYFQSENKRLALENTKNYTTQSLASVAYQINTLSFNFLQLLDLQAGQLADMESQMNHISQTVSIHKEKVARREIGVLTSNKALSKQYKIIAPANPEKPIKYVRKSIDYNALDEIGHGVRWNVNPRRSSNIQQGSATLPAPTTKPPTPPSQQHIRSNLSTTSGGSTGTLGRNTSSVGTLSKASREYRTPPAVAPPQVPSHYAPSNIVGTIRRQTNYSTLPLAQQQPQIGMVQPNQHASSSGYNHQDSLTSSMPPPPSPLIGNEADHSIYNSTQRGIIGRSGSVSPPLPPPPHDDDHVAFGRPEQGCPSGGSMPAIVPDEDDLPGWVPKNYIEKVVAIYDYYADKDDELSFQENSVIYVLKRNDDGWWEGVMDGITGLFPGNYVEPCV